MLQERRFTHAGLAMHDERTASTDPNGRQQDHQIEQVGAGKSIRIGLKRGAQTRDITVDIVDIGRS